MNDIRIKIIFDQLIQVEQILEKNRIWDGEKYIYGVVIPYHHAQSHKLIEETINFIQTNFQIEN